MWASAPTTLNEPLRRGRCPHRPAIGANTPTFQTVSGSGASAETILHLMPLAWNSQPCGTHPNSLICAWRAEEVQKPSGFWRRSLVTFFRRRKKVTRRRHRNTNFFHPDQKTAPETLSPALIAHIFRISFSRSSSEMSPRSASVSSADGSFGFSAVCSGAAGGSSAGVSSAAGSSCAAGASGCAASSG